MADSQSPLYRFQVWRANLPPALRLLLTANLVVFAVVIVTRILAAFGLGVLYSALEWLALPGDPAAVIVRPWSPFTYGFTNLFLGAPLWTIIGFAFAMYWLNWLGREYEETYGSYRLFALYLLSALFGAAVAMVLTLLPSAPLVRLLYFGAWGPVTAVLVAVATLNPNRGVGLFFLGVVPMKWIAIVFVALSLFSPDPALLGAALFGMLFAYAQKRDLDLAAWAKPLFANARRRYGGYGPSSSGGRSMGERIRRWTSRDDDEDEPTPRRDRSAPKKMKGRAAATDVDSILDKILEKGYDSLTDEEKRLLDAASRKA